LLGRGAHGSVWQAVDLSTGERVAVKVGAPTGVDGDSGEEDPAVILAREAALLRRLDHPHLIRVHRIADLPDGRRALVLDLADGGSLADLLDRRGSLEPGEVVTLVVPLAGALATLHARGLVHADVAPANVLLDVTGRPLLSDLGVARVLGVPAEPARGHLPFVAPEVRAGGAPTPASDVFALARIGRLALGDAGGQEHGALAAVLDACLDPDPARRPSAQECSALVWRAAPARALVMSASPEPAGPSGAVEEPDADADADAAVGEAVLGAGASATDVTRRIRDVAARAVEEEAAGTTAGSRRARHREADGRVRARRTTVLAAVAAAVALAVAAGGVVLLLLRFGDAGGRTPSAATPVSAGRSATAGSSLTVKATPLAPVQALPALAERRAAAITARDVGMLSAAEAPGGRAAADDAELIGALTTSKVRLAGLSFTLAGVRLLRWEAGNGAVVQATITTKPHRQVHDDGKTAEVPARTERVNVLIVPVGADLGWRIQEIISA